MSAANTAKNASEWSPRNWIITFCALGGLIHPQVRSFQWSEDVTDFENFPCDMNTLAEMSRVMIELDANPERRGQVFAYLGA